MRFVIYDDESLEAITVINLPLADRDLKFMYANSGARWLVPVPCADIKPNFKAQFDDYGLSEIKTVEIRFEPFYRHTRKYGEQKSWFAFTKTADLAMLLMPDWLPGQAPTIAAINQQSDLLAKLLIEAIERGW